MLLTPGTNLHTSLFTALIKSEFNQMAPHTIVDLYPDPPVDGVVTEVNPTLSLEMAAKDYDDTGITPSGRAGVTWMHRTLPLTDPNARWASPEEASRTLSTAFAGMIRPLVVWRDATSDAALARYVSQGLAAHLLEAAGGAEYRVDLAFMEKYSVRPGFQRYGGVLYLSPSLEPVRIERGGRTFKPGGEGWEEAKLAFRSSVATGVTIRDHAVRCHMITANSAVVATRRSLPPRHPIRRLLMPFQYRTPTINWDALLVLVGPRAIFHRLFAFDWRGLTQLYADSKDAFRMETLPEELARKGVAHLADYAYAVDGLDYWNEVRRFVAEYVGLYFTSAACPDDDLLRFWNDLRRLSPDVMRLDNREDLIELCAHLIFMATAFHAQVGGTIGDNVADLGLGAPNVRVGRSVEEMLPSKNTMYQAYMLGALTNVRMPKIVEDFSHLMLDSAAAGLVGEFRDRLSDLSLRVADRNGSRYQPMTTFDPQYLEISVSI